VYEGNDGSITATSGGGFPPYSFVEADLGLFTPPLVNLTANTYTITVSDSRGCRATDSIILRQPDKIIIIEPEKPDFIAIPNSFTPNGDGYNDFWVFKNIIIAPNNRLSVYNRWGDLIYSANNYQNNWNGSVKEGVTETTYFYVFEDLTNNKSYKGYVQVVVKN
jgi:gliding motility-associated-like protein